MTGSPISEHGSDVEQLEEPEAWKYRKCDGVYELEGIFWWNFGGLVSIFRCFSIDFGLSDGFSFVDILLT